MIYKQLQRICFGTQNRKSRYNCQSPNKNPYQTLAETREKIKENYEDSIEAKVPQYVLRIESEIKK